MTATKIRRPAQRIKLTDRMLEAAKVSSRETYYDEKARGLALRVTPSGVKSWSFVYRLPGKNPQWLSLGTYPALSLAKARTLAYQHRAAVEAQRDPVAEAKAVKAEALKPAVREFTFGDMVEQVFLPWAQKNKRSWKDDLLKLNKHLLPAWRGLPVRSISRRDVHALLDTLEAGGMTIGCNRYQALISKIFTIALDRQLVDAHPVLRMGKRVKKEQARERVLTDDEIRALWVWLDANSDNRAAEVIRLRLLTGQRGEELVAMQRDELDLPRATWTIPAERAKNGDRHIVPLSPSAKAAIERRLAQLPQNEPRIFPGVSVSGHDLRKLGSIARDTGYEWNDLRRTFTTRLAEMGVSEVVLGRLLNHRRTTVTAKHYNQHAYTDEKRKALDAWDQVLTQIIDNAPPSAATVLPFKETA